MILAKPSDEIRYWKATADELKSVVSRLEARLSAIARLLPLDQLAMLERNGVAEDAMLQSRDLFECWEETTALTTSAVGTEMEIVWKRLALREET